MTTNYNLSLVKGGDCLKKLVRKNGVVVAGVV